jgi:hypothetical protein
MALVKGESVHFIEGVTPVEGVTSGQSVSDSGGRTQLPILGTVLIQDTFTDPDSTSLDVHVPDVDVSGNGWTESSGDWEIQSGVSTPTGVDPAGPSWVATIDSTEADVECQSVITCVTANNGIITNYLNNDSLFVIQISPVDDAIQIYERSPDWVIRGSASKVFTDSTPTLVFATKVGQTITGRSGGVSVSYGSATLNADSTIVGTRCNSVAAGNSHDNFIAQKAQDAFTIFDSFTGTDGTAIISRPPDIDTFEGGWNQTNGSNHTINGNRVLYSGSVSSSTRIDPGVDDVIVECTLTRGGNAGNDHWISVRHQDRDNLLGVRVFHTNGDMRIVERSGGSNTNLVISGALGFPFETDVNLTVTKIGNTITASCLGQTITAESSFLSGERQVGFQSTGTSNSRSFDNFRVRDAAEYYSVFDTFTDTNGTALTAHTPDIDRIGTGWESAPLGSITPNSWEIQSNKAVTDSGANVIDVGAIDQTVQMDVRFPGPLTSQVFTRFLLRYASPDDYIECRVQKDTAAGNNNVTLVVIERVAGENAFVHIGPSAPSLEENFFIEGGCAGNKVLVNLYNNDGTLRDTTGSLTLSGVVSDYVGVWNNSLDISDVIEVDNFRARVLSPVSSQDDTYALLDTFTDVDSTLLTAHTPDVGGGWLAGIGAAASTEIVGNEIIAPVTGSTTSNSNLLDLGNSDFSLRHRTRPYWTDATNRTQTLTVFRYQDDQNYWNLNTRTNDGSVSAGFDIRKVDAGVTTIEAENFGAGTSGEIADISLFCQGPNIQASYNGRQVSITDAFLQNETVVGVHLINENATADAANADNFRARVLT